MDISVGLFRSCADPVLARPVPDTAVVAVAAVEGTDSGSDPDSNIAEGAVVDVVLPGYPEPQAEAGRDTASAGLGLVPVAEVAYRSGPVSLESCTTLAKGFVEVGVVVGLVLVEEGGHGDRVVVVVEEVHLVLVLEAEASCPHVEDQGEEPVEGWTGLLRDHRPFRRL